MALPPDRHVESGQFDARRESLLAAFVGPSWMRHYRRSFAALEADLNPLRGTWNWAAAFVPCWLAWRRLGVHQLVACLLSVALFFFLVTLEGADVSPWTALAAAYAAAGLVEGFWGDRWVLARALRAVSQAERTGAADDAALRRIARRGGTSLAGPVLVVALAAGTFYSVRTSYMRTYDKVYRAAMKGDLRNLVDTEERYLASHGAYTADLGQWVPGVRNAADSEPLALLSHGVSIEVLLLPPSGWTATARHFDTKWICEIWVGAAPSHLQGTPEREPVCRES